MIKTIHHFINSLHFTESPAAAASHWQNTLDDLGFSQFALTSYNHECQPSFSKQDVVTENLQVWHHHFHEQQYDADDDIARSVKQNRIPILWDLATQTAREPRMKQMISEALDYGLSAGISLTIPTELQTFAILVLHQRNSKKLYQTSPELILAIQTMTSMYCNHSLRFESNVLLTPRELEILQLSIHYSALEIAEQIHRSERTVIFHLNNIKAKLGAKTKLEAIYRALKLSLIH